MHVDVLSRADIHRLNDLGMDIMTVLDTEAEVRALEPDLSKVAALQTRGLLVTAPGGNPALPARAKPAWASLEQSEALRKTYKMEVLAFSWPARGGGAVSGTLSYKRDKGIAQLSVGALDRTISKIHEILKKFNEELMHLAATRDAAFFRSLMSDRRP